MRFYLPPDHWPDDSAAENTLVTLSPDESHHASQVLRVRPGEKVELLDGAGRSALATIDTVSKKAVTAHLGKVRCLPRPEAHLALAVAVPKGQTFEWLLEKAVELGANEITPLLTERTVVKLNSAERQAKAQKWQRHILETCKQCGQPWRPLLHEPRTLHEWLTKNPTASVDLALVASLEEPRQSLDQILTQYRTAVSTPPTRVLFAIGPEGDFTPEEYEHLRTAKFKPVTLGPLILRVETAALYLLSALRHELSRVRISP